MPAADVPDDGVKDEGLKEFWLTALANHDAVGNYISERDAEVLKHLQVRPSAVFLRSWFGDLLL